MIIVTSTISAKQLMEHCLPSLLKYSHVFTTFTSPFSRTSLTPGTNLNERKLLSVKASAGASSHCDFSSFNAPLEPTSAPAKFLSAVLQNQRHSFHLAAADELKRIADDRNAAVSRMFLASDSNEACLHRRIAQLKEHNCQAAVEDVMYMLILYKFSDIRVPLVPKLSRCIYNCRLEILPSRDWELESIHSIQILEMVREHVTAVIGLRPNSSVTDNWATTKIQSLHLGRLYAASILYAYFLKSASSRHQLERCLPLLHKKRLNHFLDLLPCGIKTLVFAHVKSMQSVPLSQGSEELRFYVMGFDPETLQRCSKLRSKEAAHLIERHTCALFGDADEIIMTSFSSLKRLVLEAVAFGSFLWDIEEYVNTFYKLKDN